MSDAETLSPATIVGLQISPGGVPKTPIESGMVTPLGLEGDKQRDHRFHGGPDRALCIYSIERIEALNGEGHPIYPGSAGENITVRGLKWETVRPGKRYRLGETVEIEITSYTTPCTNIAGSFIDGEFERIYHKTHPGDSRVYARILNVGPLRVGDRVEEIEGDVSSPADAPGEI